MHSLYLRENCEYLKYVVEKVQNPDMIRATHHHAINRILRKSHFLQCHIPMGFPTLKVPYYFSTKTDRKRGLKLSRRRTNGSEKALEMENKKHFQRRFLNYVFKNMLMPIWHTFLRTSTTS